MSKTFEGEWYNPTYSGEGMTIIQKSDDRVIAQFYSYTSAGTQLWLMGEGWRENDKVILNVEITSGGRMGDPIALAKVVRKNWGHITLTDKSDGKINVNFAPLNKTSWNYDMEPIYVSGTTLRPVIIDKPPVIIKPVPEPIPEPTPTSEPTTKIKIETWFGVGDNPRWLDITPVALPLLSAKAVRASRLRGKSYKWTKEKITVLTGTLTISDVNFGGPDHPKIKGVSIGMIYQEGESFEVEYWVGPATKTKQWAMSNYSIWTKELGEIIRVSAQVLYEK